MKSGDRIEGDSPGSEDARLGFTNEERTRNIIFGIIRQMEEERGQSGSYYDLVPPALRPFVDMLIAKHFHTYSQQFNQDRTAFKEKMSQNWVAKYRAFPLLAQDAGFIDLSNIREIPAQFVSDSLVACLTASSSYVLIGPNSLNPRGPGAYVDYVRLPLREERSIGNIHADSGAHLVSAPKMFEPLRIIGIYELRTSAVLSIWEKPMIGPTDRGDFNNTMGVGNQTINAETGFV